MPKLDVLKKARGNEYRTFVGIRQKTNMANACIGCSMCTMVCPNEAIMPVPNTNEHRTLFFHNQKGQPPDPRRPEKCQWSESARPDHV